MAKNPAFFLAANSPKGFVSFFDELYNPYKDKNIYIIKGGPGTGKSTFMKSLAKVFYKKGYTTSLIYCSSDPDSLDGLKVKEKGFVIADGTAPHVLEPRFPGCSENIINLGRFWNEDKLRNKSEKIRSLFIENSLYHRRSSGYLAAAGALEKEKCAIISRFLNRDKIYSFASRFIMREAPKRKEASPGEKSRCFLSAITPKGNIFLNQTVNELCSRIIGIDDPFGAAAELLCRTVGEGAIKNGYDVIFCHCPMKPEECEHILIPEKGLALVRLHGAAELQCDKIIHCSRFIYEEIKNSRPILRLNTKIQHELIKDSVAALKKAKETHDELESYYIDAMDFKSLNEYCDEFIEKVLIASNE